MRRARAPPATPRRRSGRDAAWIPPCPHPLRGGRSMQSRPATVDAAVRYAAAPAVAGSSRPMPQERKLALRRFLAGVEAELGAIRDPERGLTAALRRVAGKAAKYLGADD